MSDAARRRVVLVTGAGAGLDAALARRLAAPRRAAASPSRMTSPR
jgi:NAD(P)-dependent dehydrogenase (short-subunit alcohol dehydrogenase family)